MAFDLPPLHIRPQIQLKRPRIARLVVQVPVVLGNVVGVEDAVLGFQGVALGELGTDEIGVDGTVNHAVRDMHALTERLAKHPDFTIANPNRLRALVGAFSANQRAFHDVSGRGYRFLAEYVILLNRSNPQIASRQLTPLTRWRKYDPKRQELMKAELRRIMAEENISKDVFEILSKSLQE